MVKIFICANFQSNDHGSHNPDEAMRLEDFAFGTKLLAWTLATLD